MKCNCFFQVIFSWQWLNCLTHLKAIRSRFSLVRTSCGIMRIPPGPFGHPLETICNLQASWPHGLCQSHSVKQCGPGRRWSQGMMRQDLKVITVFVSLFIQLHLVCSHEMDKIWRRAAAILASSKDGYEYDQHSALSCRIVSLARNTTAIYLFSFSFFVWHVLSGTNNQMRVFGKEWVLANTNVSGYYRVNYDLDNWDRLLTLLDSNHRVSHKCLQLEADAVFIYPDVFFYMNCLQLCGFVLFCRFYPSSTELRSSMTPLIWHGRQRRWEVFSGFSAFF